MSSVEENRMLAQPDKAPPLKLIGIEDDAPTAPKQDKIQAVSIEMLTMALTALSQRFVVALSRLFSLLTGASVFWLAYTTAAVDTFALVKIGMYAVFILALNIIVYRRQ